MELAEEIFIPIQLQVELLAVQMDTNTAYLLIPKLTISDTLYHLSFGFKYKKYFTSISDLKSQELIDIYPNPTSTSNNTKIYILLFNNSLIS